MYDICCPHDMALVCAADIYLQWYLGQMNYSHAMVMYMCDMNMSLYWYPPDIGYHQCFFLSRNIHITQAYDTTSTRTTGHSQSNSTQSQMVCELLTFLHSLDYISSVP